MTQEVNLKEQDTIWYTSKLKQKSVQMSIRKFWDSWFIVYVILSAIIVLKSINPQKTQNIRVHLTKNHSWDGLTVVYLKNKREIWRLKMYLLNLDFWIINKNKLESTRF